MKENVKEKIYEVGSNIPNFKFIERDTQITQAQMFLTENWKTAALGINRRVPILGVHGSPGTGKSRFLDEFAHSLMENYQDVMVIPITFNQGMIQNIPSQSDPYGLALRFLYS